MVDQIAPRAALDAPSVLFVTYGNGHIAKVAPVVAALRERGVAVVVMALTLGLKQAQSMGLNPVSYRDYLHLVDGERALAFGRELLVGNNHPDVDESESIAYLGINFLDWVERFGLQEAQRLYAEGGRRSFLPLSFIGKVIEELRPSLIISTASPRSEQAAVEAGVSRGIPTMTMMDLFALPHDNFRRNTVFADRITVLSEFARNNLLEAGIDSARVVVTGCPAYDKLFDPLQAEAGAAWRRSMGWEGKRVVMWAGNLEEAAPNVPAHFLGVGLGVLVEQQLRALVASDQNTALLVRYHPTQYHLFPDLGTQDRVYVSNPQLDALHPQLHAVDCVVTQTSTVGFESVLLGKRLLALSFSPLAINVDFDYSKLGLGESVASPDDLLPVLNQQKKVPINEGLLPPPGQATPRVVQQVMRLLSRDES